MAVIIFSNGRLSSLVVMHSYSTDNAAVLMRNKLD
jgi:hypothetical protein